MGSGNVMIVTSHTERNIIVEDERSNIGARNRALQSNVKHIVVASGVGVRIEAVGRKQTIGQCGPSTFVEASPKLLCR